MKTIWASRWGREIPPSPSVTRETIQSCPDETGIEAAFDAFRRAYPAYEAMRPLDELRACERITRS